MNTLDHLVYMANQIARNFGTLDRDAAAEAVAEHILLYWDPRMKSRITEYGTSGGDNLRPAARQAIMLVAEKLDANA